MMRGLLTLVLFLILYSALKTIIRSAVHAFHREDREERPGLRGEDMVLDPQCGTYVVKERAITRRTRGTITYFCSEDCARQFESQHRS